jgi:hypothetical protein
MSLTDLCERLYAALGCSDCTLDALVLLPPVVKVPCMALELRVNVINGLKSRVKQRFQIKGLHLHEPSPKPQRNQKGSFKEGSTYQGLLLWSRAGCSVLRNSPDAMWHWP